MHVSEPIVAALETIGEAFVVEAEEMHDRGLQVVDVDLVLHAGEAHLVGLAELEAALHAATRQQQLAQRGHYQQQLAELDEKHSKLALQRGRLILDAARQQIEQAGVSSADDRLRHGQLLDTLSELESQTRLLVLGKRGFSSADAHGQMGLHVERAIRTLHKPVLLVQQGYTEPKRIMLAFDGSATALKGLEMLAASPLAQGLPVHLVMAGADDEASRAQMESAAFILRTAGFDTKTAIVSGEPETVLNQYQQEHVIDLMVMGAYGHSRIRQFIVGSTTTGMICKAKCSLLILR